MLNKLPVYILKRYLLLLVGLSIMAFGVAFSIKSKSGDLPDLECAVCGQPVYPADCGNSHDHDALYIYPAADIDPSEELSSDPAHAAPGGVLLWISDRLRCVGSSGNQL